jgi:GNAT superfamily N-acetyltransferase
MEFTKTKEGVRVLEQADAPAAVAVLARAFDQEVAKLTMLPDSGIRRTVLEMSVKARLYATLHYGAVHGAFIDGELGAIALWYPPGVSKLSITSAARAALTWLGNILTLAKAFPHIVRVLSSDLPGALDLAKKRGPAVARASRGITWQLELLGTLPEYRRKGLARSLLERQLRRCDQDGVAAWLETTDPVNPPIYERFGFEIIDLIDGPAWLPGYWVMRREPAHLLADLNMSSEKSLRPAKGDNHDEWKNRKTHATAIRKE